MYCNACLDLIEDYLKLLSCLRILEKKHLQL